IELARIDERSKGDPPHQTALKDKRQIKPDNVVTHNLVDVWVESFHQFQKIRQRLLFALQLSIRIDAEYVFALVLLDAFDVDSGNRANVYSDRQHVAGSRHQRTRSVGALLLCALIFEISPLLFFAHSSALHRSRQSMGGSLLERGNRNCFDVDGEGSRK